MNHTRGRYGNIKWCWTSWTVVQLMLLFNLLNPIMTSWKMFQRGNWGSLMTMRFKNMSSGERRLKIRLELFSKVKAWLLPRSTWRKSAQSLRRWIRTFTYLWLSRMHQLGKRERRRISRIGHILWQQSNTCQRSSPSPRNRFNNQIAKSNNLNKWVRRRRISESHRAKSNCTNPARKHCSSSFETRLRSLSHSLATRAMKTTMQPNHSHSNTKIPSLLI